MNLRFLHLVLGFVIVAVIVSTNVDASKENCKEYELSKFKKALKSVKPTVILQVIEKELIPHIHVAFKNFHKFLKKKNKLRLLLDSIKRILLHCRHTKVEGLKNGKNVKADCTERNLLNKKKIRKLENFLHEVEKKINEAVLCLKKQKVTLKTTSGLVEKSKLRKPVKTTITTMLQSIQFLLSKVS